MSDVEGQEHFDEFFNEVFTELENKVFANSPVERLAHVMRMRVRDVRTGCCVMLIVLFVYES